VALQGQFLKGMGVGEMPQIVKQAGAKKGFKAASTQPTCGALFRQILDKAPGKVIYAYGMACPCVGGSWINTIRRAQLEDTMETHKRRRGSKLRKGGSKVNMAPKSIPYRICKAPAETGKNCFSHAYNIYNAACLVSESFDLSA
jgi:hypothetical protein